MPQAEPIHYLIRPSNGLIIPIFAASREKRGLTPLVSLMNDLGKRLRGLTYVLPGKIW
jgi:hypothetical protein